MASQAETDQVQKDRLFDLLKLKNENEGYNVVGLDELIARAKAPMTVESIAWVEKLVFELK